MSPPTHGEARALIAHAFRRVRGRAPSSVELDNVQAVAWLETRYGAAIPGAGWGGEHAACEALGAVPSADRHPDGTVYDTCFAPEIDAREAADSLVRVLSTGRRASVAPALASPDPLVLAAAMKRTGYYEGIGQTEGSRVVYYADQIRGAHRAVGEGLALEGLAVDPVRPAAPMALVADVRCEMSRTEVPPPPSFVIGVLAFVSVVWLVGFLLSLRGQFLRERGL